jgi:hypothetical protein
MKWTQFGAKFDSSCKECKSNMSIGSRVYGTKGMMPGKEDAWYVICPRCYDTKYKDGDDSTMPDKDFTAGLKDVVGAEPELGMEELMAMMGETGIAGAKAGQSFKDLGIAPTPTPKDFARQAKPWSMDWVKSNAAWSL